MIRPLVDPAYLVIAVMLLLGVVVHGAVTTSGKARRGWLLRGLMVLLLGAVALRPGIGSVPTETRPSDVEVLVVVDRTTSMSARDWNGKHPRLHGARNDVSDLLEQVPTARFAVVSFGRTVEIELPSTSDVTLIEETVAAIEREDPFSGRGSMVDAARDEMQELLTRAEEQHPERRQVVVLMTDGENTAERTQQTFTPLAALVDEGLVLGYGTRAGGLMPSSDRDPQARWVQDPETGEPAVSRIDEANLRDVAEELGVDYLHRTSPGGLQDVTSGWVRDLAVDDGTSGELVPAEVELGWMIALALLLVVVLDLMGHWRRLVRAARELA
jgi:Ca-activated chloride channel family protein